MSRPSVNGIEGVLGDEAELVLEGGDDVVRDGRYPVRFTAGSAGRGIAVLRRELTAVAVPDRARADREAGTDAPGVRRNARLTALTGFVLLLLLGAEGITVVGFDGLVGPHLVIGTALLAPVALKLASTGWKILRYYGRTPDYVRAGPPPLVRRLLAPLVIVTTIGLLGTGIALMLLGPANAGPLPFLHRAFFAVWCAAIALHVLIHAQRSLRAVNAEVTAPPSQVLPGRAWRALTLTGTLAAGVGLAAWSAQHVAPWTSALHQ